MNEDDVVNSRFGEHRFIVMIASVVVIAILLVSLALSMYISSGAIQVDLSRPAAEEARERAAQNTTITTTQDFPAEGEINADVYKEFLKLYDGAANQATSPSLFAPEPLSNSALRIDDTQ